MRKKELEMVFNNLYKDIEELKEKQKGIIYCIETYLNGELRPTYHPNNRLIPTTYVFIENKQPSAEYSHISPIYKLKEKVEEHEKILQETILPYIVEELTDEIGKCFSEFFDTIDKAIKNAKSVKKDTEKPAKNVGKKTAKKKESK